MMVFDQLKKSDRELRFLTVALLVGVGILATGLWNVQILSARHYQENQQDQTVRTVRIPAVRGQILDRNGIPLAANNPVFNLELYLAELGKLFSTHYYRIRPKGHLSRQQRGDLERRARFEVVSNITYQVGQRLSCQTQIDPEEFHRHYLEVRALPLPIVENLVPRQVAMFSENPGGIPGLDLQIHPIRYYPHGTLAAHLIGALKRDDSSAENEDAYYNYRMEDWRGQTGMEYRFDKSLRGLAGTRTMIVNRLGYRKEEKFLRTPDPGANVILTIDLRIQTAVEAALQQTAFGAEVRGAAVVMDTRNGDILALASAPTFDPTVFTRRISNEKWAQLSDEKMRPMYNRATQENYLPGSIFKIVTALAAMEANALDPNEVIYNPGYFQLGHRPINDTAPSGNYNFHRAFVLSSNTYFITQALRPGVLQQMIIIGDKLHLGKRTEIIPRQEAAGHFPTQERIVTRWSQGDTANLSIGQGAIGVTPLQMAVMTSAIANGGTVFWPRLAAKIQPNDPESTIQPGSIQPGRVRDHLMIKAEHLRLIHNAMRDDVASRSGTGHAAHIDGFSIGGKTGTAQVERRGENDRTTWFVSFAPVESPRYAVVVMIESGASGGSTCAPVAKKIYETLWKLEKTSHHFNLAGAN